MRIDKESQLIALQLFGSDSFLSLNKRLLKTFGPNLTVFTCNLVDKYKYFLNRGMIGQDGSFFLTFENQSEDTGMTKCELRSCKKKLIEMRVLKTLMKGVPAKEFYFLNIENLWENYLTPRDKETEGLEVRNPDDLQSENLMNIKDTKSNKNKSKEIKKDLSGFQDLSDSEVLKNNLPEIKQTLPDINRIMSLWNRMAVPAGLSPIQKITPGRQKHLKARLESLPRIKDWRALFSKIEESSFLTGDNERGWVCTFDWIIKSEDNLTKVLEGSYNNKEPKKKRTRITNDKRFGTVYGGPDEVINNGVTPTEGEKP